MECIIHQQENVLNYTTKEELQNKVNALIQKTAHFSESYKKPLVLHVYLSTEGNQFLLSFETKLKSSNVHVSKNGKNFEEIFDLLTDTYLQSLKRLIHKERQGQRRIKSQSINLSCNELKEDALKENPNFGTKLQGLLNSSLYSYIKTCVQKAEYANIVNRNQINIQEILDELFLLVFENRTTLSNKNIKHYLISEANKKLITILSEDEFTSSSMISTENQYQREAFKLEEKIYVNHSGELELQSEFDEPMCSSRYNTEDIMDETEDATIHQLDLEIGREAIQRQLAIEIMKLSPIDHAIYNHAVIEEMTLEDIATIYDLEKNEIESRIIQIKTHLRHCIEGIKV